MRRERHCVLFIYKALLNRLPGYLTSLLEFRSTLQRTRSQSFLVLKSHQINTEVGKLAFNFYGPHKMNNLLRQAKLGRLVPFSHFKALVTEVL